MGTRSFRMEFGGAAAASFDALQAEQDKIFFEPQRDNSGAIIDKSALEKQRDLGQTIRDPELEIRKKLWAFLRDITPPGQVPGGGTLVIELSNWYTYTPEQPQERDT